MELARPNPVRRHSHPPVWGHRHHGQAIRPEVGEADRIDDTLRRAVHGYHRRPIQALQQHKPRGRGQLRDSSAVHQPGGRIGRQPVLLGHRRGHPATRTQHQCRYRDNIGNACITDNSRPGGRDNPPAERQRGRGIDLQDHRRDRHRRRQGTRGPLRHGRQEGLVHRLLERRGPLPLRNGTEQRRAHAWQHKPVHGRFHSQHREDGQGSVRHIRRLQDQMGHIVRELGPHGAVDRQCVHRLQARQHDNPDIRDHRGRAHSPGEVRQELQLGRRRGYRLHRPGVLLTTRHQQCPLPGLDGFVRPLTARAHQGDPHGLIRTHRGRVLRVPLRVHR